ncbi:hypothetical protein SAMN05216428_11281 [Nitrosospira sp. Nsp11]|uniref:hypothetical protein n=1 Tax=Nitrosospira sp. Nsp11 TaxID=1855338 RepID=UPI00091A5A29|nr:hypothetical protein [Nitrosospira sp. Nsp11]SHM05206.1 hypothetical protein SAMN05216428_11281 [Nitrosospira sp. Nsp11]
MKTLRTYLKSLSRVERAEFALRCGTTIGYLQKAACANDRLGETLVIALERESGGALTVAELLPDFSEALKQSGYCKPSTDTE